MSPDGEFNIWAAVASNEDNDHDDGASLEFVQRRIKAKDKNKSPPMTVMKICEPDLLITGDQSGIIKSWTINNDDFKLINAYDVS